MDDGERCKISPHSTVGRRTPRKRREEKRENWLRRPPILKIICVWLALNSALAPIKYSSSWWLLRLACCLLAVVTCVSCCCLLVTSDSQQLQVVFRSHSVNHRVVQCHRLLSCDFFVSHCLNASSTNFVVKIVLFSVCFSSAIIRPCVNLR